MLIVLSPAKRLDWSDRPEEMTAPAFPNEANDLVDIMRGKTTDDLSALMGLSEKLAKLNYDRYRDWKETPAAEDLRPACFAFAGDTYTGLDARSLDPDEVAFAQEHVRILSGLYGVLRPLDAIQPYRLEMGTRLKTPRGTNLYQYWGEAPAKALKEQAETLGTDVLVNCASQEYFGAVDVKALGLTVITPTFLDVVKGKEKVVSFNAKRARGSMARFVVTRRLTDPEGLRDFDLGGYVWQADRSTPEAPVYLRPEAS